jgi:hypothetical protein
MNLSSSTKLCIVACHSDTPLKKQIIKANHSLLKKIAHTIYINSSRYGKSIPMIHTTELDRNEKYKHILSTVNLYQYKMLIWMTDEMLLNFSLQPFIQIAGQRGYHRYKELVLQTPTYYLNPFPLSELSVPLAKEDPSLFKSPTIILPIRDVNESTPIKSDTNFVLDKRSFKQSSSISPIHDISKEVNTPITNTNFVLDNQMYKPSCCMSLVNANSNQLNTPITNSNFVLDNSSFKPSSTIAAIYEVAPEVNTPITNTNFVLDNQMYKPSCSIPLIHEISSEVNTTPKTNFVLDNQTFKTSCSIPSIYEVAPELHKPIDNLLLDNQTLKPSCSIPLIHEISSEVNTTPKTNFVLDNQTFKTSCSIPPIYEVAEVNTPITNTNFVLDNQLYKPSCLIAPISEVAQEMKNPTDKHSSSIPGINEIAEVNTPLSNDNIVVLDNCSVNSSCAIAPMCEGVEVNKPMVNQLVKTTSEIAPMCEVLEVNKPVKELFKMKFKPPSKPIKMLSNRVSFPKPEILENKKINWKDELISVRTITLPDQVYMYTYETILISFHPLPYLEFLLRKMIIHLPSWAHTVLCGNKNIEMITNWNLPINIISLDIDYVSSQHYNALMDMESFWNLFQGETLLVYNENSKPLEQPVTPWLTKQYATLGNEISIINKMALMKHLRTKTPKDE